MDVEAFSNRFSSSLNLESSSLKPLFISQHRDKIIKTISENSTVIIKGQTGCGKTTQVPQFIVDDCISKNLRYNIVCTQPRRLAAISIAKRVCEERNWQLGQEVGYQVGYDANSSQDTRLLFCTSGILMQILINTRDLSVYTHVIVDEVHERNKETDFLLMVLKSLIEHNNLDTKIILMSASIAANDFSQYFSRRSQWTISVPPVIDLTQETKFPVQIYHFEDFKSIVHTAGLKISTEAPSVSSDAYEIALLIIHYIIKKEAALRVLGAVLVFLPGITEIETFYGMLEDYKEKQSIKNEEWLICPLHSQVSHEEQMLAFKEVPSKTRKIIIATNVAESSITIPDIKYVIDFCLKKVMKQKRGSGHDSLELSWVAKSNGQQRAGRVGRTMPGFVFRLIPMNFYMSLPPYPTPEIVCCSLDELVLLAKRFDMGSPTEVLSRALNPPDTEHIRQTVLKLKEVGALHFTVNGEYKIDDGDMTYLGTLMANLPVDIHLAKLIILGYMFGYLDECVLMASAISVKNMFCTPYKKKLEAFNRKRIWADSCESDPITFLKVYYALLRRNESENDATSKSWEKKYFVQPKVLHDIVQVYKDVIVRLKASNIDVPKSDRTSFSEDDLLILKFILAGCAYPNLFANCPTDEASVVSKIGGRDPTKTVFFTTFPMRQPVALYLPKIHAYFGQLQYGLRVEFDEHRNVFVIFDDYLEDHEKVKRAVYSAVKMRSIARNLEFNLFPPQSATARLAQVTGISSFLSNQAIEHYPTRKPVSETFGLSPIQIRITKIVNPRLFYGRLLSEEDKYTSISQMLSSITHKAVQEYDLMQGQIHIAVIDFSGKRVYARVKILWLNIKNQDVKVFAIDTGSIHYLKTYDLYDVVVNTRREEIYRDPGLAIEFSLAEVEPKHINGSWSTEAINEFSILFKNDAKASAKVHSVVDGKVFVYLFKHTLNVNNLPDLNSINCFLINKSLAVKAIESYLSQTNHKARLARLTSYSYTEFKVSSLSNCLLNKKYDAPEVYECGSKPPYYLKGPFSPLEFTIEPLVKKLLKNPAHIDSQSVNSVLLDQNPEKPYPQIIAASSVFWAKRSSKDVLILKNTTVLPCFPGIDAVVLLTFSARNQLKTDHSGITGALCGLGMNLNTRQSLNGENDIEIKFSAIIDQEDIKKINLIRMFMNCFGNDFIAKTQISEVQKKMQQLTLDLIQKERVPKAKSAYLPSHQWIQEQPYESYYTPEGTDLSIRCIYPEIQY